MAVEIAVLFPNLHPDYMQKALANPAAFAQSKEQTLADDAALREGRARIEAFPGVKVTYLTYQESDSERSARREALTFLKPPPRARQLDPKLVDLLYKAEIILGVDFPVGMTQLTPNLKWVHSFSAGIDQAYGSGLESSTTITLTNQGPIFARGIAEQALAGMMALSKRFDLYQASRPQREWLRRHTYVLEGKTVAILGLGLIGQLLANMCKALGMRVIGTKRDVGKPVANVDQLFSPDRKLEVIAQSDYVVLSSATTAETMKMIGEKELAAMKPSAFLINIGRGKLIDEPVLIRALQEKTIAGAHLDCFWDEPNPPDNALWDLPNVIVTPHNAGTQEGVFTKNIEVFCDNLERYLNKQPLLYVKPAADPRHWY